MKMIDILQRPLDEGYGVLILKAKRGVVKLFLVKNIQVDKGSIQVFLGETVHSVLQQLQEVYKGQEENQNVGR